MSYIMADSGEWGWYGGPSTEVAVAEKRRRDHLLQSIHSDTESVAINRKTLERYRTAPAGSFQARQIPVFEAKLESLLKKIEDQKIELASVEDALRRLDPDWAREVLDK